MGNAEKGNIFLKLTHSFVKVMITAVETRTPYNANHTRNMVQYATKYLNWLEENGRLDEKYVKNRDPLLMSIWLHDMGKLVIPKEIMDKSTRLGGHLDQLLTKIDTAQMMEKINYYEKGGDKASMLKIIEELEDARIFIKKIDKIPKLTDDMSENVSRISKIMCLRMDGTYEPLLEGYDLEALSLKNGTLTEEERNIIQSHVSHTASMLAEMTFDGIYEHVPEWASRHHEFLDGSGYPDGLKAEDLVWETRLLTILDIYDALTAEDRPYKKPVTPEEAFEIMRGMAANEKIDGTILEDLYDSGAWCTKV